ncbi:MAG: hypothetical protein ACRELY_23990 [Polyangiaceae bacterium]
MSPSEGPNSARPTPELRKFCLALEHYRRTPEGRVRTSEEFLASFFPHDSEIVADQIFRYIARDTRAKILAGWKIRGPKTALLDDDVKTEKVVYDHLMAGDIDHAVFEEGISPDVLVASVPLTEWWIFWRTGRLSAAVLVYALTVAREQKLLDAKWFLENVVATEGDARGIDVFAPKLTKEDLSAWIRMIAKSSNATPEGIMTALGWDKALASLSVSSLMILLDGLITRIGLALDLPTDLEDQVDLERTVVQSWSEKKEARK